MTNSKVHIDRFDKNIVAGAFWNIYFDDLYGDLKRTGDGYEGMYMDFSRANPKSFVRFPKFIKFTVTHSALFEYNYKDDSRFREPPTLIEALLDELKRGDKEPASVEMALELLEGWCGISTGNDIDYNKRLNTLSDSLKELDSLEQRFVKYFYSTAAGKEDKKKFEEDGRMERLHVEKKHFLRALTRAQMQYARSFLLACAKSPWEADEVAIESIRLLAYFNEKEDIQFLISILYDQSCFSRHPSVRKSLRYLCSGNVLIRNRDDESKPEFWIRQQEQLPHDFIGWLTYDAESIFWEKRYWVARKIQSLHTNPDYQNLIKKLNNDEVMIIRTVTGKK
jgi:hypothetical protein